MINIPERSIEDIAAAIKSIRKSKNLTLREVEVNSHGVWKAVVVGSYERCDRALSIKKAISLANFYQVPLDQLLGLAPELTSKPDGRITLDIRRALQIKEPNSEIAILQSFLTLLCAKRRDWNGEVLSIRNSDLTTLALMLNRTEITTYEWLAENRLLLTKKG